MTSRYDRRHEIRSVFVLRNLTARNAKIIRKERKDTFGFALRPLRFPCALCGKV